MDTHSTLSSLNLFTLIAVVIIIGGAAMYFFRKRSNRNPEEYRQADGSGGPKRDPKGVD